MLVTGGAGYIGSHAAKALSRAGYRVVIYDNLIAGHREAVRYGPLVEGDIADVGAVRDALRQHEVFAVMHFAAFLDVGESVREPGRYYRNNVIGALSVLEAMVAESVQILRALVDLRDLRRTAGDADPRNASAAADQQLWRDEAGDRAGAAALRTRARHALGGASAISTPPAPIRTGRSAKITAPEIHLIPRAIEAATGGRGLQVFGDDYPTPDGTCLRDYIHVSDLADAHVRALDVHGRDRAVGRLQPGHG